MMGPEVSLLAIFLLLVNIWTPTVQAIPPKKFLHPHSTSGLHGGRFWTDAIETIAREAENPPDPESATWYRWFFRPDVNTYEKVRDGNLAQGHPVESCQGLLLEIF